MGRSSFLFAVAVAIPLAGASLTGGCGSDVTFRSTGEDDDFVFVDDDGTGGMGGSSTTGPAGTGGTFLPDVPDPPCPNQPPPIEDFQCDPFEQTGCANTEGCYIFVSYPTEPCGQEVYGAYCFPAGTGTQGDACDGSPCAPGFACVITGSGTQCVQLCELEGATNCPPGLVCEPIDVVSTGGCL